MRPLIDGGVFLITGASSGIGEELARQLAPRAAGVALVARRVERLEALAEALRESAPHLPVTVHPCDLTELDAIEGLVADVAAAHGSIDVLINNAGLGDIGLFEESDPAKNERMIVLNVSALTLLTRLVLPGMVAQHRGVILNVSSGFGLVTAPGFAAYVGTKHYVSGFTEALHAELAGTGVLASHLCPGPVATEFEQNAGNDIDASVPDFIEQSAADCARAAIRGIERGHARIFPLPLIWLAMQLAGIVPVPLLRFFSRFAGRALRKRLAG
jgi:short-subunit dehydrogenase